MSCQLEWVGVATWWCGLGPSGQAAWIQSIGSVIAIAIAIAIPYWQRSRQVKDKSEHDRKVVMSAAANLKIALDYEAQVLDWVPAGDGEVVHDFTLDQPREFMLLRPQTREALHAAIEKSHYFSEETCESIVKLGIKAAAYERIVAELARRADAGDPDAFFRSVRNTNQKLVAEIEELRKFRRLPPQGGELTPNNSLQRTFEPPPIFAAAKTGGASNAPELRRWASWQRMAMACDLCG